MPLAMTSCVTPGEHLRGALREMENQVKQVFKIAYIGGGSNFVPSIANGISEMLKKTSFQVELCLYDIAPDKAERMADYVRILAESYDQPFNVKVCASRREALEGADAVVISVSLPRAHRALEAMYERLGFKWPSPQLLEEGPGIAALAAATAPFHLEVAKEMESLCSEAYLFTLVNPTDVLAGFLRRATGIAAVGLCVEVEGLRGALAHLFDVEAERIEMDYVGVNHDGWTLRLRVDGEDAYQRWDDKWTEVLTPDRAHPGNLRWKPILELTRHLRSSGYHHWPLEFEPMEGSDELWARWSSRRDRRRQALEEALRTRRPIEDPPQVHPERSKLMYPGTGRAFGRIVQGLAGHGTNVAALQVPNEGAVCNFPSDVIVEIPVQVAAGRLTPLAMGEAPEWLCGYTRLLAIQRRLVAEYLCSPDLTTLKQALSVLPFFSTVERLNAFAEEVHKTFSAA